MRLNLLLLILLLLGAAAFVNAQMIVDEGFDDAYPPSGWDCDSVTRVDASFTTPLSPDYCTFFDSYTDYLRTPLLPVPGTLAFSHKKLTGNCDFWVQVGYNPTGPWTNIAYFWAAQDWHQEFIDLTAYSNIYIRFYLVGPPPNPQKMMFIDDVYVCEENTVPVELSSFTATLAEQLDQIYFVKLQWVTQTETQIAGYRVFRNSEPVLQNAVQINPSLIQASNTSQTSTYTYMDEEATQGTWYYWLQSNELDGSVNFFGPISVMLGVNIDPELPPTVLTESGLRNPFPNPFNVDTTISYLLAAKADVKLDIFNEKGQLVWTSNRTGQDPGLYNTRWDGRDLRGKMVTTGVYYCRMTTENFASVRKLMLMK